MAARSDALYTLKRGRIADFSGGQNDMVHPSLLNDNEAKVAQNVSLDEKGTLISRKGIKRRFANAFDSSPVAGMCGYYKKDGTSRFVIAAGTSLYTDKPHIVYRFDAQADWNSGTLSNIDSSSTPGSIKIATPPGPSFSRSSAAYQLNGTQVASGVPRYEAGRFGQAIMVEEGTTNLLAYSEAFEQWMAMAAVSPNSTSAPNGTMTADTVSDYDTQNVARVYRSVQILQDTAWYTVSIFVKKDTNTTRVPALELSFANSAGARVSLATVRLDTTSGQTYAVVGSPTNVSVQEINGYYRLSYSLRNPGTGVTAVVLFYPAHSTSLTGPLDPALQGSCVVWGAQLEKTPYVTTYVATGNSAATRSHETLTIPGSALSPTTSSGTFETCIKLLRPVGTNPQFIFDGAGSALQNFQIYVRTDGKLECVYGTGTGTVTLTSTTAIAAGAFYYVAATWSSGGVKLYLNGAIEASSTTAPNIVFGPNAYIGSRADGTLQLDGVIDDLRISSGARSDAEILADYQSSTPLEWDYDTVYKVAFDGNLNTQLPRSGNWMSPVLDISGATDPNSGIVSWVADQPAGTELIVETRTSADGVSWSEWANATNGGLIASPYNQKLQLKVKFRATSTGENPVMHELVASYDGLPSVATTLTGLSPGGNYFFAVLNDTLIVVNGIDVPKKWDGMNPPVNLGGNPPRGKYVAVHKNRVFFGGSSSNPSRLYFSDILNPDAWPILNFIDIAPDDGDLITGVMAHGDYLVITKQHSVWLLAGDSPSNFSVRRVLPRIGCIAPRSLCAVGDLISFVGDDGVYFTDLVQATLVSERIRKTWDGLNRRRLHQAAALTFDHKLYISLPEGTSTYNNLVLVYDLIRKAWLVIRGWKAAAFTLFRDAGRLKFYLGDSTKGQVYEVGTGASDDGAVIEFVWESPHFHFGAPEHLKRFKRLFLEVVPDSFVDATLEVAFVADSGTVSPAKVITVPADASQAVRTYRVMPSDVGVTHGRRLGIRLRMATLNARVGVQGLTLDYFVKGVSSSVP